MTDAAWTMIGAVIVCVVSTIIAPYFVARVVDQKVDARMAPTVLKLDETHRAVTVNHHSSEKPTVLDRLDDQARAQEEVATELKRLNKRLANGSLRFERIESTIGLEPFIEPDGDVA